MKLRTSLTLVTFTFLLFFASCARREAVNTSSAAGALTSNTMAAADVRDAGTWALRDFITSTSIFVPTCASVVIKSRSRRTRNLSWRTNRKRLSDDDESPR